MLVLFAVYVPRVQLLMDANAFGGAERMPVFLSSHWSTENPCYHLQLQLQRVKNV